jgi:hypothetical protein
MQVLEFSPGLSRQYEKLLRLTRMVHLVLLMSLVLPTKGWVVESVGVVSEEVLEAAVVEVEAVVEVPAEVAVEEGGS